MIADHVQCRVKKKIKETLFRRPTLVAFFLTPLEYSSVVYQQAASRGYFVRLRTFAPRGNVDPGNQPHASSCPARWAIRIRTARHRAALAGLDRLRRPSSHAVRRTMQGRCSLHAGPSPTRRPWEHAAASSGPGATIAWLAWL